MSGFSIQRDEASAAFFDGAAQRTLMIRRCPRCGKTFAPKHGHCADGTELTWVPASGLATLVTWATDHTLVLDPALAGPDGRTATFALVELAEGPWLQVPIVDANPQLLEADMAMEVCFVRPGEGETIPAFTPRRADK